MSHRDVVTTLEELIEQCLVRGYLVESDWFRVELDLQPKTGPSADQTLMRWPTKTTGSQPPIGWM